MDFITVFELEFSALLKSKAAPLEEETYQVYGNRLPENNQDQISLFTKPNPAQYTQAHLAHLQSNAYFYFSKILVSQNYMLGKKLNEFLNDFLTNYRSIEESSHMLPLPVIGISLSMKVF